LQPFDVAVIGGGITGAGIARDAAMRGLRTVLVEKGDIASGTSSASSKLVHGGLRYLEQGSLGLVFESVTERHRLRLLAPHLVRPLPFVFPVYEKKPKPLWMVRIGLWMYDAMALFRAYRLHRGFNAKRTINHLEPALLQDGLDGSVLYYDCLTDDARLSLETARAAHEAGAWILSYTEVVKLVIDRSQVAGVEVVDRISGTTRTIQARAVVNATGPWSDRTVGLRGDRPRLLRPTKGIHVVVARERLPVRHAVVISNAGDQRVVFAVPWGNRVMIGTTDTDYEGDFDEVHAERDEVEYLLDLTNRYFPTSQLEPSDVLGTFAGLRPLVGGESAGPSEVSREHIIRVEDDGLISVAGGKLTTYRLMAAEVLKVVAKRLRTQGVHVGGCHTGSVRLPGGHGIAYRGEELITLGPDGAEAERAVEERLGKDVAEHLQESYGGRWTDVAARAAKDSKLGERILGDLPYIWAEVDYAVEEEMAITLRDFMRRRTQLEIRACREAMAMADAVGARMGQLLNWTEAELREQVQSFRNRAARSMAWRHHWEEPGARRTPPEAPALADPPTPEDPEEETLIQEPRGPDASDFRGEESGLTSAPAPDEEAEQDETIRA